MGNVKVLRREINSNVWEDMGEWPTSIVDEAISDMRDLDGWRNESAEYKIC